jgi:hypothetical protein
MEEYQFRDHRIAKDKSEIKITSEVEGINPEWNELIEFRIGKELKNQPFDPNDVINSRN